MNHLRNWLGNPRIALLFFIIYVISQSLIIRVLHAGNADALLIQLQLTYDADTFNQLLAQASSAQIAALQGHYFYDFIHPVWYGMLALSLTSWLLNINRLSQGWSLPLIPAIIFPALDVLENILHSPWIFQTATATDPLVLIAGIAATVKWSLAAVYLMAALLLSGRYWLLRPQLQAA